ncbi:MAG TPA: DUF3592 domain-containing protein [Thermoanaerobaculia bacterium]|nr:DUF3592 domain-containing protein [Thermoanaerobaculia bacterium]
MHNYPVMLAPPPRQVPLSLALLNIFGVFSQVGWAVFGFGMIFAWAFIGNADFSFITFRGPHAEQTARVTRVAATGASENDTAVIANHYEYSVAGVHYTGTSYSRGGSATEGERVTVEYDEDHPERSRISGMRRAQFGPGVMFVGIFPLIGVLFIAFSMRGGFRRTQLLRNGLLATGKLLGRERTNVTINDRPVWKLTFEYTARDGQRHEAFASTTDTQRLEDESDEPLLYDPNNPTAAYVLDELPSRPEFEPTGELRGRTKGYFSAILPGIVIAGNLLALALKMDWL